MANYNGVNIGKALFFIITNNTSINATNLLDNDASLVQPAPMRSENDPALGVTYEIDSITNVDIKRPYYETPPVNISTVRLEVFAKDYSTGTNLATTIIGELITTAVPATYNNVKIERITIDNVKQDFNTKSRRYVWTLFLDITTYNQN